MFYTFHLIPRKKYEKQLFVIHLLQKLQKYFLCTFHRNNKYCYCFYSKLKQHFESNTGADVNEKKFPKT